MKMTATYGELYQHLMETIDEAHEVCRDSDNPELVSQSCPICEARAVGSWLLAANYMEESAVVAARRAVREAVAEFAGDWWEGLWETIRQGELRQVEKGWAQQ